ncbi:MAG TPA: STAS domain-containing protein [Pseudonocardiaceae bacterium]|jgi:anti-anti-sigma factor|nr:STAS domain-containing protein [Pseudonocardiaceae bacterium]
MTVATVRTNAEGGSLRITLSGEIDLANAATVENEIFAAVPHHPSPVLVDLTDLDYMDSVGVRILFELAARLQELGSVLTLLVPLDSPMRQLVEISGLDLIATLQPSRA